MVETASHKKHVLIFLNLNIIIPYKNTHKSEYYYFKDEIKREKGNLLLLNGQKNWHEQRWAGPLIVLYNCVLVTFF